MMNMKMMGAALLAGAMAVGCSQENTTEKAVSNEAALTVNGQTLDRKSVV